MSSKIKSGTLVSTPSKGVGTLVASRGGLVVIRDASGHFHVDARDGTVQVPVTPDGRLDTAYLNQLLRNHTGSL